MNISILHQASLGTYDSKDIHIYRFPYYPDDSGLLWYALKKERRLRDMVALGTEEVEKLVVRYLKTLSNKAAE
ncbi:MAG: hypothetical protein QHH24_04515 [Candidatus Bathyarchaeota archaeon]|jgi:hypothetical protein|nr:hypothetical protein [Candidatus Bathyarchaeota archaeon]